MHHDRLKVGMRVRHRGTEHYVHSYYGGACGRRIVQVSPRVATSGDAIICNNVPVDELEEVDGPGKSSGGNS